MANAQCPSCSRWLNLPESAQGQQVQCPLCRSVFVAPSPRLSAPIPVRDVPDPALPWRPAESPGADRDDLPRPPETSPRTPVSRPLGLLANWIFGLSLMSFLWNASCGCGGLFPLGRLFDQPNDLVLLVGFLLYFVPLVIYLVVMITSQTLYTAKRNRNVFWFGIVLIQLEYIFGTVRLFLLIQGLNDRGELEAVVYLNAVSIALAVGLMVTSALAMRQLQREKLPPVSGHDPDED